MHKDIHIYIYIHIQYTYIYTCNIRIKIHINIYIHILLNKMPIVKNYGEGKTLSIPNTSICSLCLYVSDSKKWFM